MIQDLRKIFSFFLFPACRQARLKERKINMKNFKPVCAALPAGGRQARLKIFLVVPCSLLLVTFFSAPAFAQNVLVNSSQSITLTPTPSPVASLEQVGQNSTNPILDTFAQITSYVLTLGNPVHFDNPKTSFSPTEKPSFILNIPTKDQANIGKSTTNTWQTTDEVIQAILVSKTDNKEIPAIIHKNAAGLFVLTVTNTEGMPHGDYSLQIDAKESIMYTRNLTQDFSWGVVAVNTNKSIYAPHEKAILSFGVLNETGGTLCNAGIDATITDPQGNVTKFSTSDNSIQKTKDCGSNYFTNNPDYFSTYQTGQAGTYQMHIVAQNHNGTHSIDDYFEVKDSVPFDVERSSFPTR